MSLRVTPRRRMPRGDIEDGGKLAVEVSVRVHSCLRLPAERRPSARRPAIEAGPENGSISVGTGHGDSTVLHFGNVFGPDASQVLSAAPAAAPRAQTCS